MSELNRRLMNEAQIRKQAEALFAKMTEKTTHGDKPPPSVEDIIKKLKKIYAGKRTNDLDFT
jgi:hypothetical protein